MIKLAEAINREYLNAKITVVISDKHCVGIARAVDLAIPTQVIERQKFPTQREHEAAIQDAITDAKADYVFLAGYMAVLRAEFTNYFAGRLLNIHPSLLPEFRGLDTHQRAINANASRHGATVHLVSAKLDDGPIILQAEIPVSPKDDANNLAAKVLELEHQLYPFVLKKLCDGKLMLTADKVIWQKEEIVLQIELALAGSHFSQALRWPDSP